MLPFGEVRAVGGHRPIGLAVQLDAERLDRGLEANGDLGLPHLLPLGALADLGEGALGLAPLAAQAVEPGGDAPHGLGLLAPAFPQAVQDLVDVGRSGLDLGGQPFHRGGPGIDLGPTTLGVLPLVDVLGQPGLDLAQPLLGHPLALPQRGLPDLEVGPPGGEVRGPLLDRSPEQAQLPPRGLGRVLVVLQVGQT